MSSADTQLKVRKKRVTLALCCSTDGSDKLPPLIIGHSKAPRCFKNINLDNLGCTYRSNSNAWMAGVIFSEWLENFDKRMWNEKGKAVLLLDHFSDNKPNP